MSTTTGTSQSAAQADARVAERHASLRWAGAPLLLTGVLLLVWTVGSIFRGGPVGLIMLGFFGTGMGLASFGANHDAAIAFALKARSAGGALSASLTAELDEELERDRAGTMGIKPAPNVAMALPFFAMAVQAFLASRLFGG